MCTFIFFFVYSVITSGTLGRQLDHLHACIARLCQNKLVNSSIPSHVIIIDLCKSRTNYVNVYGRLFAEASETEVAK